MALPATSTRRFTLLAGGARLFAACAIITPLALVGDQRGLLAALLVTGVWTMLFLATLLPQSLNRVVIPVEAGVIATLTLLAFPDVAALTAAIAIPPLIAGLWRGAAGVVEVLVIELFVFVLAVLQAGGTLEAQRAGEVGLWVVAGLGLGMIATFVHTTVLAAEASLIPYTQARGLLTRLLDLSEDLTAGLDPVSIAGGVSSTVIRDAGAASALVFVRRGDHFAPLLDAPAAEVGAHRQQLLEQAWRDESPAIAAQEYAFPLAVDGAVVALVAGSFPPGASPDARTLATTSADLLSSALRLDTALLFAAVREAGTSEERQRLAREVHDGIGQEVASLGYFVDALADGAEPEQAAQLQSLRDAITRVVAEIRRTVYDLRSEAPDSQSLGDQIRSLADRVAGPAGIAIEVEVDESPERLRAEVEGELFRITQEALNNLVKHARARSARVSVIVRPPHAEIEVRDDGRGLQAPRSDSHGLRIMSERARRIGGNLSIEDAAGGGVSVRVTLGSAPGEG